MGTKKDHTGLFKKGKSGNPGGRPKKDPELKEIFNAASPKAAYTLVMLMDHEDPKIALAAADKVLDRSLGKPVQAMEHTGKDGDAIKFAKEVIDRPPRETFEEWQERRKKELEKN